MVQGILAYRKLCEKATNLQHYHPDWSCSKIGKKIRCSHSFVSRWVRRHHAYEALDDLPRSGRLPRADAAAQQHLVMAAQLPQYRTAGIRQSIPSDILHSMFDHFEARMHQVVDMVGVLASKT